MGTRFELALLAVDDHLEPRSLRAAGEAAIDEIDEWHRRLSRFAPDSLVAHINRSAATMPVRLDRETFELFSDALSVWQASEGAFDVTVAPALVHRGFPDSAVPVRDGRADSQFLDLDSATRTIRFGRNDMSLDLGGIAKGHALECAASALRNTGVDAALLSGGTSSVIAIGKPDEQGWRVALGPDADADVVDLENAALSLSDPASQRDRADANHIIDPRPAAERDPAATTGTRVAVIGPSARIADAWSTALAILGRIPAGFPAGYQARFLGSEA
jgi:thiamine biosynthesis lipoprotein